MSLVEVLPIEPVIPTKRAVLRSRTRPASAASAAKASSGTSVAAAPRAKACLTKSAPVPTATKRSPSSIRRESIWTPVTSSAHRAFSSAPGQSAVISSSPSGIMPSLRPCAVPPARPPGRRTARCGCEDVLERVGRVRVIDDDGERLALVDTLETARHASDRLDAPRDRVVVDAEEAGSRHRRERVLDVEPPAELEFDSFERIRPQG